MRRARTIVAIYPDTCVVSVSVQCANAYLPSIGQDLLPDKTAFVQVCLINRPIVWHVLISGSRVESESIEPLPTPNSGAPARIHSKSGTRSTHVSISGSSVGIRF